MKKLVGCLLTLILLCSLTVCMGESDAVLEGWMPDSSALSSILTYVASVTDPDSPAYVPPANRIVVFDMDGTLYGERFPTYFDETLLMHRLLHDDTYAANEEDRAYAQAVETALLNGEPEPDSSRSSAQMAAESFKGFTVEEYRAYVRAFMQEPAVGFANMTYGEGFYVPMLALVRYLAEQDFVLFISSGSERSLARELTSDARGEWIPSYRIIGSTFSLTADGQGSKEGRKYTMSADDEIRMEGNLVIKNQRMNKVYSILDEIGMTPILVFGNSSGDLSMARYAIRNGGKAYMLLCADLERDWGDLETAADFAESCAEFGCETVSMRDDFATIYGPDVIKTERKPQTAQE